MGLPQLKSEIDAMLANADDRLLKMVHAMASAYEQDIDSRAIRLDKMLEEGEADIASGNVFTTEELLKDATSWKVNK